MYLPTLTHFVIINVYDISISAFTPCINLEQLDIRSSTLVPFEDQSPSLQMNRSKTPRILHFRSAGTAGAYIATVERLLRAKWKDGRSVLDFTHVKTLVFDFQVSQEVFENVSYLKELQINGMFTCLFFVLI